MVQTRSATPSRTPKRKKSTKNMATEAANGNGSSTPSGKSSSIVESLTGSPASPTPTSRRTTRSVSHQASVGKGIFPADSAELLAPKSEHYEFGGPLGCLFVILSVPFFAYALFYFCNDQVGCSVPPENITAAWNMMKRGVVKSFYDGTGWLIYFGWYAFTVLAWAVLPGETIDGTELRTGIKLPYKVNAFATMVAALAITAGIIIFQGPANFTFLYDHWEALITASLINSIVQAVYVHISSFGQGKLLAKGANTGNLIHDWFMGRELNPRIGTFDIKYFNELRPGLILWVLLNISCACAQYIRIGHVTDSMILVLLFHGGYVVDGLLNEPAILTTMDITTDGFGFMLSVGDLVWVPFTYGLQARFLVFHPIHLGVIGTLAIFAMNGLGYYIFRTSNGEKNAFRNGKDKKNLKFMTTSSGRKLITSGWWGRSRHPNYMGDLIMALAWSLPCGITTPIPYFYVCYFLVLLIHRQIRDDEACRLKYGKDWDKYCKLVPYRIFPYVY